MRLRTKIHYQNRISAVLLSATLLLVVASAFYGCQSYHPLAVDLGQQLEDWRRLDLEGALAVKPTLALEQRNASTPPPLSLDDGLSLTEAEWLTLCFNPELRVARAQAGVARASAQEAGWLDDPEFQLEISRFLGNVESPWIVESAIGFTIPLSSRLNVEKQAAWAAFSAAQKKAAVAEWEKLTALRAVWIRWSNTRIQLAITGQYIDSLDTLVTKARDLAEVGELATTDARVFELEQAERRAEFIHLQSEEEELSGEILHLTAIHPLREIKLLPTLPSARGLAFTDDVSSTVTLAHPELLQLQAEYETAERQLLLELQKQRSDLRLAPMFGREGGEAKLGAGIGFVLPLWNKNRRAIAESLAAREQARILLEAGLEKLTHQLAQANRKMVTVHRHHQMLEEVVIPITEQQLAETAKLLELGEVNVLLIQDAMERSFQARLNALAARSEEALAQNELRRILEPAEWAAPPGRGEEK